MDTKVKLLRNVPTGLAQNEKLELIGVTPFVGKVGTVVEEENTGYDTERPTGYEPTYCLVNFGEEKIWIPWSLYMGEDEYTEKEIWERYLKRV